MNLSDLSLHSSQLCDRLLPFLIGRVFHVTPLNVFEQILGAREIRSNVKGEFNSVFGSTNSFFRNRGCISFFDYRSASHEQIESAIGKCSPFHLPSTDLQFDFEPKIAFLFLATATHDRLIPWTKWEEEESYSEKIIPWVEVGYPDSVPLTLIEETLRVTIDYPADSLAAAIRHGRVRGART